MDLSGLIKDLPSWADANMTRLLISLGLIAIYFFSQQISKSYVQENAEQSELTSAAVARAVRTSSGILKLVGILLLVVIWGINIGSVMIFASTAITLLGVALFANWSLLSNITAYFVLLAHPSLARGNVVRILEADNYIEGRITDLTLFNLRLETVKREVIVYPNNLVLTRPFVVNPSKRLEGAGKLVPQDDQRFRPSGEP
ncbi:MAG: hypothetical protein Cons2KO_27870 [Congregibacter sp.]